MRLATGPPTWDSSQPSLLTQSVWHWSHVSENILLKAGFMNNTNNQRLRRKHGSAHIREFGLDGIALDENGVYHGIQAKNWSHTLCANHLGSFFLVMFARLQKKNIHSQGFLYHTGRLQIDLCNDLTRCTLIDAERLNFYDISNKEPSEDADVHDHEDSNQKLEAGGHEHDINIRHKIDFEEVYYDVIKAERFNKHVAKAEHQYELYGPQKQALDALIQCVEQGFARPRLLNMACGTGKTVVLARFLQHLNPRKFEN
jgi:predicted helicase